VPGTKSRNRVDSHLGGPTCDIHLVGSWCSGDNRLVYGWDRHLSVQYEAVPEPTFGANRIFGGRGRILLGWTCQLVD
jgi:hypothetical protein